MSTFSGLSGALSSLYAQRRGLDVTGQNIANANTEGYSRQRVEMKSVGGSAVPCARPTDHALNAPERAYLSLTCGDTGRGWPNWAGPVQ